MHFRHVLLWIGRWGYSNMLYTKRPKPQYLLEPRELAERIGNEYMGVNLGM